MRTLVVSVLVAALLSSSPAAAQEPTPSPSPRPGCGAPPYQSIAVEPTTVPPGATATVTITVRDEPCYADESEPHEVELFAMREPYRDPAPVTIGSTDSSGRFTYADQVHSSTTYYFSTLDGQARGGNTSARVTVEPCPPQLSASVFPASMTAGATVQLTVSGPADDSWTAGPDGYRRVTPATTGPIADWTDGSMTESEGRRSITWAFRPTTSSRVWASYQGGCTAPDGQAIAYHSRTASSVISVAPRLSITAVRNGTRDYTFSGQAVSRPGQTVNLYRLDAQGREILTARTTSTSAGTWAVRRSFTGSGRYGFLVRTGADAANAAGASTVRSTLIY